jgi:hypothetical protein
MADVPSGLSLTPPQEKKEKKAFRDRDSGILENMSVFSVPDICG